MTGRRVTGGAYEYKENVKFGITGATYHPGVDYERANPGKPQPPGLPM